VLLYMFQYERGFGWSGDPGSVKEDRRAHIKGSGDKKIRDLEIIIEEYVKFINELGVEFRRPKNHLARRGDNDAVARQAVDSVFAFMSSWTLGRGAGYGGSL
jgi:hypothetical protein